MYVTRNPKDAIVSFYYHHKLLKIHNYTGDLEDFAQYFMDDEGTVHQISTCYMQISDHIYWF